MTADVGLGGLGPSSKQQTWVLEAWPQSESGRRGFRRPIGPKSKQQTCVLEAWPQSESRRGFRRPRPKVQAADVGFGGLAPK